MLSTSPDCCRCATPPRLSTVRSYGRLSWLRYDMRNFPNDEDRAGEHTQQQALRQTLRAPSIFLQEEEE